MLLGQGLDGSRSNITDLFKEEGESVLLGTESLWEGVDLPGEVLQLLLLVKLPFAVPTDPLVEARMEQLESMGLNPFVHYSVPEAVMKFRQGFGRLIRTRDDRGVVLILDKRVVDTWYGKLFLGPLPTDCFIFRDKEKLLQKIKRWFKG